MAEAVNLVVTGASMDTRARQAQASAVMVTDGRFFLRRKKDASVNVSELSKLAEAATNKPEGILVLLRTMTNVVAMLLNSTNLSNDAIGELALTNCALHMEDLVNEQPVRLDLDRIVVKAQNVSNRAGTILTANASLRWDTNGTVRAAFKAVLSPASTVVTLAFYRLNLRLPASCLEPHWDISGWNEELSFAHLPRYFDGLRIRSSRSVSDWRRASCRRRC